MSLAFAVLRWPPETFWRATPRELVAALQVPGPAHAPITSGNLARLMQAFPDATTVIPGGPKARTQNP